MAQPSASQSFSSSCSLSFSSFDRWCVKSGSLLENVNEGSDECFLLTSRESITSTIGGGQNMIVVHSFAPQFVLVLIVGPNLFIEPGTKSFRPDGRHLIRR